MNNRISRMLDLYIRKWHALMLLAKPMKIQLIVFKTLPYNFRIIIFARHPHTLSIYRKVFDLS